MNQPLGNTVGNALEVKEAIATLHGDGPAGFWIHCEAVAAQMVLLAGKAETLEAAKEMVNEVRGNGRAWGKFRQLIQAQGGDVSQADDPSRLPQASLVEPVLAPQNGFIAAIDTAAIGWASVRLGAGRLTKEDKLDYAVGLVLPHEVGAYLEAGQPLGEIHANDPGKLAQARDEVLAAITWSNEPVEPLPHFYGIVE
jgi:pyrimidine-nucleoside phosphorylase